MMGPCMCGDTACPSCGPAQGYDPGREMVVEWLCEQFRDAPEAVSLEWLSEFVADELGKDQDLADALFLWAKRRARDYMMERAMPNGEDWFRERQEEG